MYRTTFFTSMLVFAIAAGKGAAIERPTVEIAPARLALGIYDIRMEAGIAGDWRLAGQYTGGSYEGERDNYRNREQTFRIGALYYPMARLWHSPFFGATLAHSTERIGHQADRPRISYYFPRDGGDRDVWTNEVNTLALAPEIGYRINLAYLVTASVRYLYTIPIHTEVTTLDRNIIGKEIDTTTADSSPQSQTLSLHLGMLIP